MSVRDTGVITALGSPAIAGSFHTLVLQPTSFCNLDCTYCYLPNRRSRRLMSVPVATACARSIEQQQDSGHPVSVVWHGGEPTSTSIDIFRDLLASFEPLRNTGNPIRHRLYSEGKLVIEVASTVPLGQAAEAHRQVETGHVRGKVALIAD